MHVIERLAEFVVAVDPVNTHPELKNTCQLLVADLMAAAGAGYTSDLANATFWAASEIHSTGDCCVWFRGASLSVQGAAMANAAAASALDLDDGHRGAAGHAGAGVIPAVLAVAQYVNAGEEAIFNALILGYDVALRVATSRPLSSIDSWVSGRWVGYGIAAGVAKLLGLNARQTAHAMAIVGAEGPIGFKSGSSKYLGSSVKEQIPVSVGAAINAAFRAKYGATGPLDLLDPSEKYDAEFIFNELGEKWFVNDNYLKPYACCRYMHAAIDGILSIRDFSKPIFQLEIETFERGLGLSNERAPRNLESGQYSYYFSCALAALRGAHALQPVVPESLSDADVLALAQQIRLSAHSDFAHAFPRATPCRIRLDQGDGLQEVTVLAPLGDVSNPMSFAQVMEKLQRITRHSIAPQALPALEAALHRIASEGFDNLFDFLSRKP